MCFDAFALSFRCHPGTCCRDPAINERRSKRRDGSRGQAHRVCVRLELAAAGDGAVADGGPFFVGSEEGGLVDAGPEGFAFDAQRLDGVEVGAQIEERRVRAARSCSMP
jgi:hypothetical protein